MNESETTTGTADGVIRLTKNALADVPSDLDNIFKSIANKRPSLTSDTLTRTNAPCAIQSWCDKNEIFGSINWDEKFCSHRLKSLPIFSTRGSILEKIKSADVTIILAPCGTGKSLIAPLLLAEMLKEEEISGERSVSRRGLTICPSGGHGNNIVKTAEKLYMLTPGALCAISNFVNPFEQSAVSLEEYKEYKEYKARFGHLPLRLALAPMHAITNYRGGMIAIDIDCRPNLKLLHIDEVHSTTPELLDLLALARRQLYTGNVEKLLLTSATLDKGEIEHLGRYFAEHNLTLEVVNFSHEMQTAKRLTMSCAQLGEGLDTGPFEETQLSKRLADDFEKGNVHRPSRREDKLQRFGSEEQKGIAEMNHMLPYVKQAVDRAMERATEIMEENKEDNNMPSILVLIPGKEHADRIRSTIESTLFNGGNAPYKFFKYKDTGKPGFILQRLNSKSMNPEVSCARKREDTELADGMKVMSLSRTVKSTDREEMQKWEEEMRKELRNPVGPWGGMKGTIILATPNLAGGLTLDNVAIVIDSGVMRIAGPYLADGLKYRQLTWIDKRLLFQRAGRCGRTCDGEYFLCVSGRKVERILQDDIKGKLLLRNFDEISWVRAKRLRIFDELICKPPKYLINEFMQCYQIRGLWVEDEFTSEAKLLFRNFPFLTPDLARFVVMGVRLGLAAHTICYVAEITNSHKLCGRPSKIRENYSQIGDSDAYDAYVNKSVHVERCGFNSDGFPSTNECFLVRPYDKGDSVAKADMIVTWFRHTFPPIVETDPFKPKPIRTILNVELEPDFDKYETYDNEKWKQLGKLAASTLDGYFWSGQWCTDKSYAMIGMKKLQQVFIRDDGREAVCMSVSQLTRACQRLGLIYGEEGQGNGRGSIFSPRFNRYLRDTDTNYNLNEDGRALFLALLTMSSDKVASASTSAKGLVSFKIDSPNGKDGCEYLYSERKEWKIYWTEGFVRYWDAFKTTHSYSFIGCLDPVTNMQALFFLNAFGKVEKENGNIMIHLNAWPKGYQNGISFQVDEEVSRRVLAVRESLVSSATRLVTEREGSFEDVEKAIIRLWQSLGEEIMSRGRMNQIYYLKYPDRLYD